MKDVIKDQSPEEDEKPKIKAVLKEAAHSLIHYPAIALAYIGFVSSKIQIYMAQNTALLAMQDYLKHKCPEAQSHHACFEAAQEETKKYHSILIIIIIIASLPVIALCGWLCTKFATYRVALVTYLIMSTCGFLVAANISDPFSWSFKIGYLTSLTVDSGNYIVILTMLTQNLLPNSRGILMVFLVVIESGSMLALSICIPMIQDRFGGDYIKGGEHIYFIFYSVVAAYWVLLLIYNLFKFKSCEKKITKIEK